MGLWIGRTCVDIKGKVEVTESLWNDILLSTDKSFALVYLDIIKFLADNMEVSFGRVICK